MANNYLHVPAVGQLDPYACWAACLKWWYKAAKTIGKSQRGIIDKYNYLTDQFGAMSESSIEYIIANSDMYPHTPATAAELTYAELQKMLSWGPVYIAYTETPTNKRHVNVIYGLIGNASAPQVRVMEPQAVLKSDFSYRGAHQIKPLSDFNRLNRVYCGTC